MRSTRIIRTKGSTPTQPENAQEFQKELVNEIEKPESAQEQTQESVQEPVIEQGSVKPEKPVRKDPILGGRVDPILGERPDPILGSVPAPGSRMRVSLGNRKTNEFQMDPTNLANTVHLICQSKGGTGKTYVASTLASFLQLHAEAIDMYCFDLDSNRESFSSFDAFAVQQFSETSLDEDGHVVIDPTAFDGAFNPILESIEGDAAVVIDTGAGGSFWALVQYLQELDYPTLVAESGKNWRFIVHIVISGSAIAESVDTISRLLALVDSPYTEFVVWGNEYFGNLRDVYADIVSRYGEVFQRNVNLPKITDPRLDAALRDMRERGLSVAELLAEPRSAIDKARLTQYYYGNMAGKPGVFTALRRLDWSPTMRG